MRLTEIKPDYSFIYGTIALHTYLLTGLCQPEKLQTTSSGQQGIHFLPLIFSNAAGYMVVFPARLKTFANLINKETGILFGSIHGGFVVTFLSYLTAAWPQTQASVSQW